MDPLHGEPANRHQQLLSRVILWSLAIKKQEGSSQAAARDRQLQEPTGAPTEGRRPCEHRPRWNGRRSGVPDADGWEGNEEQTQYCAVVAAKAAGTQVGEQDGAG